MEGGPVTESAVQTLVYRPSRRFFLEEVLYALVWTAMPGIVVSLIVGLPWAYASASITAVVATWSMRRSFRILLVVNKAEVTVSNYWKTYVIPWESVTGVAMMAIGKFAPIPIGQPALGFFPQRGRLVKAQATPANESERDQLLSAVLSFAPDGVRALTPPPDWWADRDRAKTRRRV
jgi:hypothetical protein